MPPMNWAAISEQRSGIFLYRIEKGWIYKDKHTRFGKDKHESR